MSSGTVSLRIRPKCANADDRERLRRFIQSRDVTLLVKGEPATARSISPDRIEGIVERGHQFACRTSVRCFKQVRLAAETIGEVKLLGAPWDFPWLATWRVFEFSSIGALEQLKASALIFFNTKEPASAGPTRRCDRGTPATGTAA